MIQKDREHFQKVAWSVVINRGPFEDALRQVAQKKIEVLRILVRPLQKGKK